MIGQRLVMLVEPLRVVAMSVRSERVGDRGIAASSRDRCCNGAMEQIWFVTGSSRGLGHALVDAVMEAGDRVAATAREPSQLDDLVADYGDRIRPIALDVTDAGAARSAITEAHQHFGRLDVIVNNAGYANVSPIETSHDDDFRAQFETNFWGVYNVTKAAIPILREQRSGLVIRNFLGRRTGRGFSRYRFVSGGQIRNRRLQSSTAS